MNPSEKLVALLREDALAQAGKVSLPKIFEQLVSVRAMRDLAREHGVTPKGGFRLEKAPARVLVPALTDGEDPKVLEAACEVLATQILSAKPESDSAEPAAADAPERVDLQPVLRLKEQELERARADLDKAREVAAGLRIRLEELNQSLTQEREHATQLRKEVATVREHLARSGQRTPAHLIHRDQSVRIQTLEKELEEHGQVELQQRHKIAEQAAMIRELDERNAELDELVPKGKKRKKRAPPPAPEGFVVPSFAPSFHKSLLGRDRRAIENAYRSVFLFCTEGSRYPGLQVKALDPSSVWSLRASLKLRVYFRWKGDADVEILELLDRQEQDTALRRYKEK